MTHAAIDDLEIMPACGSGAAPRLLDATVLANDHVGDRYWLLRLSASSIAAAVAPGQFLMMTIARRWEAGPVLPRPMAVFGRDVAAGTVDVMYGVVGDGTRRMTTFAPGEAMTVVGPLGRGFTIAAGSTHVLLVGRGVGTCSLTLLAEAASRAGRAVTVVESARTAEALVAGPYYRAAGVERLLQVTDAAGDSDPRRLSDQLTRLDPPPDQIFVCGSARLVALCRDLGAGWGAEVQVSLEAHMACGIGYCHGCSTGDRTARAENPLICRDGPVFRLPTAGFGDGVRDARPGA